MSQFTDCRVSRLQCRRENEVESWLIKEDRVRLNQCVSTTNWNLPMAFAICSAGWICAAVDLWHTLKGVQDGEWGALCSKKAVGTSLRIPTYFHDLILWVILVSPHIWKALNPSQWHQQLMTSKKPFVRYVFDCMNSPSSKSHILIFPLFRVLSQS